MGTEEIYFAGGGEPFMHPEAMRIFSHAKRNGFHVSINTNFSLVTEEYARALADEKIDHLIVSVWAGTSDVYAATHPNKSAETFEQVKNMLTLLNTHKGKKGDVPIVKVYNVMFNMNYHDFDNMIQFIIDTNSESVEFTVIDTIPEKTDTLLLSEGQARELHARALKAKEMYCKKESPVWIGNMDTFLRRVSSTFQDKGEYDRAIMDEMPCYAGWTFARIIGNGDVNSCLKSHRIPIGNLHDMPFEKLWNNPRQRQFRQKTRSINANDPYFRFIGNDTNATIGCYRSCDNLGHSLLLHEKIERLYPWQRHTLKALAGVLRTGKNIGVKIHE